MSKRAQQNQSAFNIGNKIGLKIAKDMGAVNNFLFNARFKALYKGQRRWQAVVRQAARIGYATGLDKAAKATQPEPLTGEQNA